MRRPTPSVRAIGRAASCVGVILLVAAAAAAASAQQPAADAAPRERMAPIAQVDVSGSAEVSIPANKASFSITIATRAATAAAASADNARIARAVTEALRRVQLPPADLTGTRLIVNPQWQYDDKTHQQRRTGYEASNALQIDTARLGELGAYIDAALNAGATQISSVDFSADDASVAAARHQALSQAVANARADAQAIAQAAGGTLGPVLQLGSGENRAMPVVRAGAFTLAAAKAPAPATQVVAGPVRISATVSASWRLVAR